MKTCPRWLDYGRTYASVDLASDRKVFCQDGSKTTLSSPGSSASVSCQVTPGRCTATSRLCGNSSTQRACGPPVGEALPASGLRNAAWRLPPRRLWWIWWLAGQALLRCPPPGLMERQQGQHATDDTAAVPDAVVGEGTGWCSRRRRTTTTCR